MFGTRYGVHVSLTYARPSVAVVCSIIEHSHHFSSGQLLSHSIENACILVTCVMVTTATIDATYSCPKHTISYRMVTDAIVSECNDEDVTRFINYVMSVEADLRNSHRFLRLALMLVGAATLLYIESVLEIARGLQTQ